MEIFVEKKSFEQFNKRKHTSLPEELANAMQAKCFHVRISNFNGMCQMQNLVKDSLSTKMTNPEQSLND